MKKIKIPVWIQIISYILMITVDGIYIGCILFATINHPILILSGLFLCLYGTYFVFSYPYIKECKQFVKDLEEGWIDRYIKEDEKQKVISEIINILRTM